MSARARDGESVARSVTAVRARVAAACRRVDRDPCGVRLVAVTKGRSVEAIRAAHAAGLRDFGENRIQEAAAKVPEVGLPQGAARWHLIGHLQRNKVKVALRLFDILHSVDSLRLAEAVSQHASRTVTVLLEVNIAGEASKHGVAPGDAAALAERIAALPRLRLAGLMTVAPQADTPEDVRPVFRSLCRLRDELGLGELSMGMTDDFEVAIEEGATMVRIGRAIFAPDGEAR